MTAQFSFDGIEDLALAVHEAAALVLVVEPDRIELAVWRDGDTLLVELEVDTPRRPWPPPGIDVDVRWHLLTALCDRVWLLEDRAGVGLSQARR